MIEVNLFFVFAGCFLGVLTGLVPGIHVNTLSIVILGLAWRNDLNLVLLVVSMSIVHSIVDFIPSILLGAPDASNYLSVLPGHRFLLKGFGLYAVKLTVVGGIIGGIFSLLLSPIFLLFIEDLASVLPKAIPVILATVVFLMVASEENLRKKGFAVAVIFLSATLSIIVLRGNLAVQNQLFPMITGFFGASTLIYSIKNKQKLVPQKIFRKAFPKKSSLVGSLQGILSGIIVSVIPSIGPNEAAFILRKLFGKISSSQYLVLLGSVSTSAMIYSFFTLFALGKARTGSAVAVKELISISQEHLLTIVATILIALGFSFFATNFLAKKLIKSIQKINYRKLNSLVLIFVTILILMFSQVVGFIVFLIATFIGLVSLSTGIKRTHCMGFLIIPTILIYLGL